MKGLYFLSMGCFEAVRYQAYGLLDIARLIMQQGRAFYYDGKNLPSTEVHNLGLSTPRKVAQSLKHQPL